MTGLVRVAICAVALLPFLSADTSAMAAVVTFYSSRSAFDADVPSQSLIDFEGLVADNSYFTVPGSTVAGGVPFSVSSGFIGIAGQDPGGGVLGSPFNSALMFSNNSAPITAQLAGLGVTAAGATFGNMNSAGRSAVLTLTGTTGVLDTRTVVTGDMGLGATPTFFGWSVVGDTIVGVTYSLANGHPHYEGIDDFVYAQGSVVPEPTSISLALIGTLGLVSRKLRRRRAK